MAVKIKVPEHYRIVRDYVCQTCGLGLHSGRVIPDKNGNHRYVMGHGNYWDCGPVVEIPTYPRFVEATDSFSG